MLTRSTRLWLLFLLSSPSWAVKKQHCAALPADKPQLYGYHVVAEFPHDPNAFTQGAVVGRRSERQRKAVVEHVAALAALLQSLLCSMTGAKHCLRTAASAQKMSFQLPLLDAGCYHHGRRLHCCWRQQTLGATAPHAHPPARNVQPTHTRPSLRHALLRQRVRMRRDLLRIDRWERAALHIVKQVQQLHAPHTPRPCQTSRHLHPPTTPPLPPNPLPHPPKKSQACTVTQMCGSHT